MNASFSILPLFPFISINLNCNQVEPYDTTYDLEFAVVIIVQTNTLPHRVCNLKNKNEQKKNEDIR